MGTRKRQFGIRGGPIWGACVSINAVNADPGRDPFNTAVADVLKQTVDRQMGIVRAAKLTGIPRSTLTRYLDGDRDIPVAKLRLIAHALNVDMSTVLVQAQGRIEEDGDGEPETVG